MFTPKITCLAILLVSVLLVACGPVPTPRLADTPPPTLDNSPNGIPVSIASPVPSDTLPPMLTETPIPTNTPLPLPLVDIFPLLNGGQEFVFINNDGVLKNTFVTEKTGRYCVHSNYFGLQLEYDMKGQGNGGWGIQWDNSPNKSFDASMYTSLFFWVRGIVGNETFQIGLADTTGKEVKIESKTLGVVEIDWIPISIPLTNFTGVNPALIKNLNFGFNPNHGTGMICIDDIAFVP